MHDCAVAVLAFFCFPHDYVPVFTAYRGIGRGSSRSNPNLPPEEFTRVRANIASLESTVKELEAITPNPDYPAEIIEVEIAQSRFFIAVYKYLLSEEGGLTRAYEACAAGVLGLLIAVVP